jgi:hypothetical protein
MMFTVVLLLFMIKKVTLSISAENLQLRKTRRRWCCAACWFVLAVVSLHAGVWVNTSIHTQILKLSCSCAEKCHLLCMFHHHTQYHTTSNRSERSKNQWIYSRANSQSMRMSDAHMWRLHAACIWSRLIYPFNIIFSQYSDVLLSCLVSSFCSSCCCCWISFYVKLP